MGMKFTVTVTGKVRFEGVDASDAGLDADDVISNLDQSYGTVSYDNASIEEVSITIEADASVGGVEVNASDLADYDAEQALSEAIDNYSATISHADFTIDDEPTGFSVVEDLLDREQAIAVYAALDAAGHTVE